HVLDASRAVPVVGSLISPEARAAFIQNVHTEYEKLRQQHAGPQAKLISIEEARQRKLQIEWKREDVSQPEFIGSRVLNDFSLTTLREFIDWSPFFHTWELRGRYPKIFEHEKYGEQAR